MTTLLCLGGWVEGLSPEIDDSEMEVAQDISKVFKIFIIQFKYKQKKN